ncbi:MAG: hypothetical protein SPE24_09165 [Erysipelotrichaceae bacterium]|nr:hypothetical protein [Erysipelotrichaceae bacterium]
MKYYKLLNDGEFIGVGTSYDLRKFQLKHSILLTSDDESAQYIQIDDKLYRDDWFSPTITELLDYTTVKIIVIEKDEYDTLFEAIETGKEIEITDEEPDIQEELPQIDSDEEVTIEYVKAVKSAEMSATCNKIITNGFDVILSDGENHHFSLTIQDQLNLITLSSMVAAGETVIPYHADGELCKGYSVEDITTIINTATSFKTYHVTYFNSLKVYIDSMNDINEVNNVVYGIDIPEEYQSDVLKQLLS